MDSTASEEGTGFYEKGNEPSGSIKGRKFVNYMSEYYLLIGDINPWSSPKRKPIHYRGLYRQYAQ
jgi:hypothetical protein